MTAQSRVTKPGEPACSKTAAPHEMRSGVGRATVGTHAPAQGSVPEKAARLFEFLTELQRLRTKVTRTLDSYDTVL